MARIAKVAKAQVSRFSKLKKKPVSRFDQVRKKVSPLCVTESVDLSVLDLLTGKRTKRSSDSYVTDYTATVALVVDDSPIRRVNITVVQNRSPNEGGSALMGKFTLPIAHWKDILPILQDVLIRSEKELLARGVPKGAM